VQTGKPDEYDFYKATDEEIIAFCRNQRYYHTKEEGRLCDIIDRQAEQIDAMHKAGLGPDYTDKVYRELTEQLAAKDAALRTAVEACKKVRAQNPIVNMGFLPLQRICEQALKGKSDG
jgi:hypothetical protein